MKMILNDLKTYDSTPRTLKMFVNVENFSKIARSNVETP